MTKTPISVSWWDLSMYRGPAEIITIQKKKTIALRMVECTNNTSNLGPSTGEPHEQTVLVWQPPQSLMVLADAVKVWSMIIPVPDQSTGQHQPKLWASQIGRLWSVLRILAGHFTYIYILFGHGPTEGQFGPMKITSLSRLQGQFGHLGSDRWVR